jgi:pantothenate kinase-related protein Tda10
MKGQREETPPTSFDEIKFKVPFTCIISGPRGSGKSSFCIGLLQNLKSLYIESRFDGGIILCYSEKTAVPSQLGKTFVLTRACPILTTRTADRV